MPTQTILKYQLLKKKITITIAIIVKSAIKKLLTILINIVLEKKKDKIDTM